MKITMKELRAMNPLHVSSPSDNAIYLLTTEGGYSYEEISYLIKNGMLQDASFITSKGRDFDTIQDNLDFYARFFQSIM